jgi:hypothetical protein
MGLAKSDAASDDDGVGLRRLVGRCWRICLLGLCSFAAHGMANNAGITLDEGLRLNGIVIVNNRLLRFPSAVKR